MTPDEQAYLHDLSIYVGKKFTDEASSIENNEIITYGTMPQDIIDLYNERFNNLIMKNPSVFKPLISSIGKSL